jgi:hypothetical protein
MVFLMCLIFGAAGLTIDLGHAYVSYRQLQTSTDAAAMGGAYAMVQGGATRASVTTYVQNFSSAGGANATPNLPSPTIATTYGCLPLNNLITADCSGSGTNANVIQVTQQSTIPTYFIKALAIFGITGAKSLTLTATATATMGGIPDQVNVAIVLDSTASMAQSASNCGGSSKIKCALNGVQTLLSHLAPCTAATATSGATCAPFDSVSLFTYPNVQANQVSNDTACKGTMSKSYIIPYTAPSAPKASDTKWTAPTGTTGTYQISGYSSDWSSNNALGGSFGASSNIVNATGGSTGSNCNGIQALGGQGTYFAGAINAAQGSLQAQSFTNTGTRNVMIILSDGDANSSSAEITGASGLSSKDTTPGHKPYQYGSANSECHQAIDAANNATANGTTVFAIAYGSSNTPGCSTDNATQFSSTISPCQTLQQITSGYASGDHSHFYSDGSCSSVYSLTDLKGIFSSISTQLTRPRLIPTPGVAITGT